MKSYFIAGLLLLVGSMQAFGAGQPFAAKANIPASLAESPLAQSIAAVVIPDQSQVGIPAYPGAVAIRSFAVDSRPSGYEGLAVVEMISTDDYAHVIESYKQQLPQWGQAELMSAYYFAEHGNINFFKPEEPHVGVHKLSAYFRQTEREVLQQILPGAQTLIKVFFIPPAK